MLLLMLVLLQAVGMAPPAYGGPTAGLRRLVTESMPRMAMCVSYQNKGHMATIL